jgi:hypothetical protein
VSADQAGPSRRLTPDEEARAATQFALGASDRQVAAALGVGTGTANRLRHRLADRITELAALAAAASETGETPVGAEDGNTEDSGSGLAMTPVRRALGSGVVLHHPELGAIDTAAERGERLAQETKRREELAARLADLEERAAASRQALAILEAERTTLLADGKDAAPLRPRVASASADLADWETAAGMVRQEVGLAEACITAIQAEEELTALREQLAPSVAERDAAIRATGGRMAAAVLAVREAAEEFTAALLDEKAARERADLLAAQVASLAGSLGQPGPDMPAEPESTILNLHGGDIRGPELELVRAMGAARMGHVELVAKHLAEAFGWLPQSREEQAAEWEQWRLQRAERDRQMLQPKPAAEPWTRPDRSFDVDQNGREIRYPGYRPPRAPHPMDTYNFPGL